jgi:prepilin-type N-terminal cleavage/methylation domain-containing protein
MKQRALTLIEPLVVIAIIAILAANGKRLEEDRPLADRTRQICRFG